MPQVLEAKPFLPCNTFQTSANASNCWGAFLQASEGRHNLDREHPCGPSHAIGVDLCKGGDLPEKVVSTFLAVQQVVELHVKQNFEDALR